MPRDSALARRLRLGLRLSALTGAALAVWAYSGSHMVLQWDDRVPKVPIQVALGLALAALGVYSLRRGFRAELPWLLVFALFVLGEAHRLWLRHVYRFEAEPLEVWPIVTTTDLKVRRYRLPLAGLRAPLRVLHLSDLHVTPRVPPEYVERVRRAMRDAHADLVVLTGDYVSKAKNVPAFERWLDALPPARFGTYAVLGNHDYWAGQAERVRTVLSAAHVELVTGECRTLDVGEGTPLRLCGTDAPWGRAAPDLRVLPPLPTVVLSHTPDNVYELAGEHVGIVLAGHTHGGQLRVPWFGALLVPSDYGRRFDRGHFVIDATHLVVSTGIGADAPPLRLFCPPELVVAELVPG